MALIISPLSPLTLLFVISMIFGQKQISLYDSNTWSKGTFSITTRKNLPRLDIYADDLNFQSSNAICLTGAWVLYENINFGVRKNQSEVVQGDGNCIFRKSDWSPGSVRSVGDPKSSDIKSRSLNIYAAPAFGDASTVFTFDGQIPTPFKSFIITGTVGVTFFKMEGYKGMSFCFKAAPNGIARAINDTVPYGIYPGDIKSFKFGCVPTSEFWV